MLSGPARRSMTPGSHEMSFGPATRHEQRYAEGAGFPEDAGDALETRLDEALEATFPASDPIAMSRAGASTRHATPDTVDEAHGP